MNNFQQRTLTGIILIIVVLLFTNLSLYSFAVMVAFLNLGGLVEFYRLVALNKTSRTMGLILGSFIILATTSVLSGLFVWKILFIIIPIAFMIIANELYAHHPRPFEHLAYSFMGLIYITLPSCFFIALAFLPFGGGYNAQLVTSYFFILWASDIGAYLVGKYLGKNLLFKRISPHKTWEGCIGGILSAILVAVILSNCYLIFNTQTWLIFSIIITVTGIYGDLSKSMLKRSLGVKDTGTLLPGHGGILDRFDSLLGSAPFAFSYLLLYGPFKN
ncbi:CDP-archaeol synthase [Pedobacter gandavensis]|uniref:phosphatidate cytidylyltransferase n=1 Tax=Pedobacter gandavensis TaxID=2679963 RepID=UPI00247929A1|nr:CDP-archaeol synthase [Pedobacter gandavensis]WGQ10170.1 CDP-archaeol synthase [Pedobacter gandavensis]